MVILRTRVTTPEGAGLAARAQLGAALGRARARTPARSARGVGGAAPAATPARRTRRAPSGAARAAATGTGTVRVPALHRMARWYRLTIVSRYYPNNS